MKKKAFIGSLDRLEGDIAIVITEDDSTVEIARSLLPEGAEEGDILSFKLEVKDKKTKEKKEEVERLIKKLSSS